MIELIVRAYELLLRINREAPIAGVVVLAYPAGVFIGYWWTQALRRAQRRRAARTPGGHDRLGGFELAGFAALVSGCLIGLAARVFFAAPLDHVLAHMVFGGAVCPAAVNVWFRFLEWKLPTCAERVKRGERLRDAREKANPDITGEFYR